MTSSITKTGQWVIGVIPISGSGKLKSKIWLRKNLSRARISIHGSFCDI